MVKSAPDSLESIKKKVRRIRRSGSGAELFGFLLIVFAGVISWVLKSELVVLIVSAIFVVLGIYFIFTGTYIKSGMGRRIKLALLANSIISFPLCAGIIPIYFCIQSANNYTRFKELPESIKALYSKPKSLKVKATDLVLFTVIIILCVVSVLVRLDHISNTNKKANASVISISQPAVYKDSTYNFSIKFPGKPSVFNFTETESGHIVNYNSYETSADNGAQEYQVFAYYWPAPYFNFSAVDPTVMTLDVKNSLNTIVGDLNGKVISSSSSTFLGHISEVEQFSAPTFDGSVNSYIQVFYVANYEYAIITRGATQTEFNNFVNSFKSLGS